MKAALSIKKETLSECVLHARQQGYRFIEWQIANQTIESYLSLVDTQEKIQHAKDVLIKSGVELYGLAINLNSFDAQAALAVRQAVNLAKKLGARSLSISIEKEFSAGRPPAKKLQSADYSLKNSAILSGAAPFLSRLASYAAHSAGGCGCESPSLMISYDFNPLLNPEQVYALNDSVARYNAASTYRFSTWKKNQNQGQDPLIDAINHFEFSMFRAVLDGLPEAEELTCFLDDLSRVYDGFLVIEEESVSFARLAPLISGVQLSPERYDQTGMSYPSSSKRILKPLGTYRLLNPESVRAGEMCGWTLTYVVGEQGIAPGGGIKFRFHHFTNTGAFQLWDECQPGYCTIDAGEKVHEDQMISEDACRVILCTFPEGLPAGQEVRITIGDPSQGSPGIRAQQFQQEDFTFFLAVDALGRGYYFEHPNPPKIKIEGNQAEKIVVILPSVVRPGETFDVHIRVEDSLHNCAVDYAGQLAAYWESTNLPVEGVAADKVHPGIYHCRDVVCPQAGVDRLVVVDNQGLCAYSNYIQCSATAKKVYWGDIHGHCALMDSITTPEQYLKYGREIAFLDFCALSEHMDGSADETFTCHDIQWQMVMDVTEQFNDPPAFVTLLGYENSTSFWDANVYFKTSQAPWAVFRFPDQLFEFAKEQGAMVIPHMTTYPQFQRGYNWAFYDADVIPLIEIYSTHGASEYFGGERPLMNCEPGGYALDALAKGYQIGFMAAGDGHDGMPGNSPWGKYINGITAVYTEELSREGVFEALQQRRCYATTNERILVEFEANQHEMGEAFQIQEGESLTLSFKLYGTSDIDEVIVVSDGKFVQSQKGTGSIFSGTFETEPEVGTHYYYVKMRQKNGEMLWISPVFVEVTH